VAPSDLGASSDIAVDGAAVSDAGDPNAIVGLRIDPPSAVLRVTDVATPPMRVRNEATTPRGIGYVAVRDMRPAELADIIAALSLDEARALVGALRERLAVAEAEDDAFDGRNFFAVYGAPPPPEHRDCVVVLHDAGPERLRVMACLRTRLALGLFEARAAVTSPPVTFGPFDDRPWAEFFASALRAEGATVSLHDVP
jgi:ribosomal protein L7/L12